MANIVLGEWPEGGHLNTFEHTTPVLRSRLVALLFECLVGFIEKAVPPAKLAAGSERRSLSEGE